MTKQDVTDLIYKNQGLIWKICHTFYTAVADREDLFQEIVIQLWKSYPKFEERSKFTTWLYRVALNTAISYKKKSRNNIVEFKDSKQAHPAVEENDFEESEIELLYRAIEKLSKIDKAIILLYLEEKSYAEMAEITGFSINNISVRLVRIRKKLDHIYHSII